MTQRYLQPNNNDVNWIVRANTLIGNSNENITIVNDNSSQIIQFNNKNTNLKIGFSFLGVPIGSTSNRPVTAGSGYMRYNSQTDLLEYFKSGSFNDWFSFSNPPNILSVSPFYVSIIDPSITILGSSFSNSPSVIAIGNNGSEFPAQSTSVNGNQTEIHATFPSTLIDNSNLEPFDVKVISSTSLETILENAFVINDLPQFTLYGGNSPPFPVIDISKNYTVTGTGLLDISASDPEHPNLTFTSSNLNSVAPTLTLNTDGTISGTTPNPSEITTYTFNVTVDDGTNTISQNFQFRVYEQVDVQFDSTNLEPYLTTTYLDNGGSVISTPEIGGFTLYQIVDTTIPSNNYTGGTSRSGTFSLANNLTLTSSCSFLLVAGGGGGGCSSTGSALGAGGGGAGGVVLGTQQTIEPSTSRNYTITVGRGGGGAKGPNEGGGTTVGGYLGKELFPTANGDGIDSTFNILPGPSNVIASGGGAGARRNVDGNGFPGGSGGGASGTGPEIPGQSNQNTYSGTANITGYGNDGGLPGNLVWYGTGGGGAGAPGQNGNNQSSNATTGSATNGGIGIDFSSYFTNTLGDSGYFGGGAGGGGMNAATAPSNVDPGKPAGGLGGTGGGGEGGTWSNSNGSIMSGNNGLSGTGGGGGATSGWIDSILNSTYSQAEAVAARDQPGGFFNGGNGGSGTFILKVPSFS
jgi:hypothetical protein